MNEITLSDLYWFEQHSENRIVELDNWSRSDSFDSLFWYKEKLREINRCIRILHSIQIKKEN